MTTNAAAESTSVTNMETDSATEVSKTTTESRNLLTADSGAGEWLPGRREAATMQAVSRFRREKVLESESVGRFGEGDRRWRVGEGEEMYVEKNECAAISFCC